MPSQLLRITSRRRNAKSLLQLNVGNSLYETEAKNAHTATLTNGNNCYASVPPTMVPLSQTPLLLLQSSAPIVSRQGCALLCQYFDSMKANNNDAVDATTYDGRILEHNAQSLLSDIHNIIDKVTNCPRHDNEMQMPRYVRYHPTVVDDEETVLDHKKFMDALLPDGLHVDTNNGKLFRHITAILYLTDNQDGFNDDGSYACGGGTSFPLAVPLNENRYYESNNLQTAAKSLLKRDILHTKGDTSDGFMSDGSILETASLGAFHKDNISALRYIDSRYNNDFSMDNPNLFNGVRVMPGAGKLIYFHNVGNDGLTDSKSWHGGEELINICRHWQSQPQLAISKTKSILVFFKEIPIDSFRDVGIQGFAEEATRARTWTKEMYY